MSKAFIDFQLDLEGNLDNLKNLVPHEVSPDATMKNEDGVDRTLLSWAITHLLQKDSSSDLIDFLLKKGADINKAAPNGQSPMTDIIRTYHNADMMKFLLVNGANPNALEKNILTPLGMAIRLADLYVSKPQLGDKLVKMLEVVGVLVTHKGINLENLTIVTESGKELIHLAGSTTKVISNEALLNILIPAKKAALETTFTIPQTIAELGDLSKLKDLVTNKDHANATMKDESGAEHTLLSLAITNAFKKNSLELVEFLLEKGADVNKATPNGDSLIVEAITIHKSVPLVKFLISKGASLEKLCIHILEGEAKAFLDTAKGSFLFEEQDFLDLLIPAKVDDMFKNIKTIGQVRATEATKEKGTLYNKAISKNLVQIMNGALDNLKEKKHVPTNNLPRTEKQYSTDEMKEILDKAHDRFCLEEVAFTKVLPTLYSKLREVTPDKEMHQYSALTNYQAPKNLDNYDAACPSNLGMSSFVVVDVNAPFDGHIFEPSSSMIIGTDDAINPHDWA